VLGACGTALVSSRACQCLAEARGLAAGTERVARALCRGTISAADIVTDAIVYPEPMDSWLPQSIKEVRQAAGAGMLAGLVEWLGHLPFCKAGSWFTRVRCQLHSPPPLQKLSEPAFAHAGMMAAAKSIFQDMTERGILQEVRPPLPRRRPGSPPAPVRPRGHPSYMHQHTPESFLCCGLAELAQLARQLTHLCSAASAR
jgi:pentatricopeptide repeat protein